ncbi:MAG: HAD-IA family hydrolase [Treponemataceae bacterium]
MNTALKAVFFDQDGVIVDTEKDGHRVSFNKAFAEFGINAEWDVETYHKLLQIGGGKERIKHYFQTSGYAGKEYAADPDGFVKAIHKRKTDIFIDMIRTKQLPLRPGIYRLMKEIKAKGLLLGICTTSAEDSARAVVENLLTGIEVDILLAGDIVKKKKPDPEIYLLAMEKAGVRKGEFAVVEDSAIGVAAAVSAGAAVVATVNDYTRDEAVDAAKIIVDCLGEPDRPAQCLRRSPSAAFKGYIDVAFLASLLGEK